MQTLLQKKYEPVVMVLKQMNISERFDVLKEFIQSPIITGDLTNLQLELLKLYNNKNVPDELLRQIKKLIAKFYLQQAQKEGDKVWNEKKYTTETINDWLNEP